MGVRTPKCQTPFALELPPKSCECNIPIHLVQVCSKPGGLCLIYSLQELGRNAESQPPRGRMHHGLYLNKLSIGFMCAVWFEKRLIEV